MTLFKKMLLLAGLVLLISCNSISEPPDESKDESAIQHEMKITDEKIDHLGITNKEFLSAASKRACNGRILVMNGL